MNNVEIAVRNYGLIPAEYLSFSDLVDCLRRAGMDLHPSIVASNWEPESRSTPDFEGMTFNYSAHTPSRVSQRCVLQDIASRGLRSLSPLETLAFLFVHGDSLVDDHIHFVSLGYVWRDFQNVPAVMSCFRLAGRLHIGPVVAYEDSTYPDYYRFLVTER